MKMAMCPACGVEHESVEAMGTTVIGCPRHSGPPVMLGTTKRLPIDVEAAYERAAVALEIGGVWPDGEVADVGIICWRAFDRACGDLARINPDGVFTDGDVELLAARLLRECIAAGKTIDEISAPPTVGGKVKG